MTSTEIGLGICLSVFLPVICFAFGLFTGWRMGRESQGKPPFSFENLPPTEPKQEAFIQDDDPWARALQGKEIV